MGILFLLSHYCYLFTLKRCKYSIYREFEIWMLIKKCFPKIQLKRLEKLAFELDFSKSNKFSNFFKQKSWIPGCRHFEKQIIFSLYKKRRRIYQRHRFAFNDVNSDQPILSNACLRSAMMSSGSSMPTENLMRSGEIPASLSCSSVSCL